jgi:hypothetical protein
MILTSGGSYLLSFALDLRRGAATPPEVFPLQKALTMGTYLHAVLNKLRISYEELPLVTGEIATIFTTNGVIVGGRANGNGTFSFGPIITGRKIGETQEFLVLVRPVILTPDELQDYILRLVHP